MKKKLLTTLLALSMALTLLPATALAEGEEDAAGETAAVTFPVNEGSTCEALVEISDYFMISPKSPPNCH